MKFTEATRVQIPAMVHLTRLGYTYYGKITEDKAGSIYDADTNILIEVFRSQFEKLNPHNPGAWAETLHDIRKELNDDDLGRGFYTGMNTVSPYKLRFHYVSWK